MEELDSNHVEDLNKESVDNLEKEPDLGNFLPSAPKANKWLPKRKGHEGVVSIHMRKLRIEKEKTKRRYFALELATNGMNATQAYKTINPTVKDTSAGTLGYNLLKNVETVHTMQALLPSETEDVEVIKHAYSADRDKKISWKDLRGYVETSLKLKGYLNDSQRSQSVNIGLVVKR